MPLDKIIIARQNLILPTLIFLGLAVVTFIGILLRSNKKTIFLVYFAVIFLVAFDLLRFVDKWMPIDPKDLIFPDVPVTSEFSKISGFDRTFGNFGGEVAVYYKLPSVEGYDALYIKNYGEFISSLDDGKLKEGSRSVISFPKNGIYTSKAINLLNVKYIVHKLSDGHQVWAFPFWTYPENQFKLLYKDQEYEVYQNMDSFLHAFLVSDYAVVTNPQESISAIFGSNFDLRNKVVLSDFPGIQSTRGIVGQVKIEKYTPNDIKMNYQADRQGLLILTDSYYPGWEAKIDGKTVPIYRADYTFRGIVVPQGNHSIEFTYYPLSFRLGEYLATAGILGILGLGLVFKRKNKNA
jgi:hypothetical protein